MEIHEASFQIPPLSKGGQPLDKGKNIDMSYRKCWQCWILYDPTMST